MARKTDTEPTVAKTVSDIDVSDIPADNPESVDLAKAIERANELIEQKKAVLAQLQDARQYCDLTVRNGIGSREQVAWVRFYLPRKERKEKETAAAATA